MRETATPPIDFYSPAPFLLRSSDAHGSGFYSGSIFHVERSQAKPLRNYARDNRGPATF